LATNLEKKRTTDTVEVCAQRGESSGGAGEGSSAWSAAASRSAISVMIRSRHARRASSAFSVRFGPPPPPPTPMMAAVREGSPALGGRRSTAASAGRSHAESKQPSRPRNSSCSPKSCSTSRSGCRQSRPWLTSRCSRCRNASKSSCRARQSIRPCARESADASSSGLSSAAETRPAIASHSTATSGVAVVAARFGAVFSGGLDGLDDGGAKDGWLHWSALSGLRDDKLIS
jgi:hypothetical protein